ncbi:MAG TPA: hypothetical protein DCR40_04210 [Prolixibacteraceae bacterium]|nr:hypothetical protein [Prolixibacteraceae bacterium]
MTEQDIAQKPVNFQEFSSRVKAKYPDYKDVDDLTLAKKMVEKYPEYRDQVSFDQIQPETEQPLTFMQIELRQKFPENYTEEKNQVVAQNTTTEQPKTKEDSGFWSTWLGDAMQGFAGTSVDIAGNVGALQNLPMRSYLNYKTKELGIGDEERKVFVDSFLQTNPATSAAEELKVSAKEEAKKLEAKSDRYNGEDFTDLWKKGEYGAVAGDIFLQGAKSLPYMIMAMGGGAAGLGAIGATSAAGKYEQLDNPELPQIFTEKQKADFIAQKNMGEFQKLTNSALSGTSEAATELLGSVPMGKYIGRLVAKSGEKVAKEVLQKGISAWTTKMFDRFGLIIGPVAEGIEEYANSLATNTIDYFTGANTVFEPTKDAAKSFVYGMGGGAFGSGGALAVMGVNKLNPRQSKESEITTEANELAHQTTGTIVVGKLTTLGTEENTPVYIVSGEQGDISGAVMVRRLDKQPFEDGKLTKMVSPEMVVEKQETTKDEYVQAGLASFDQTEAVNQEQSNENKMVFNGKTLIRIPNGEGLSDDGKQEAWLDENENAVWVPIEEVQRWEKEKIINSIQNQPQNNESVTTTPSGDNGLTQNDQNSTGPVERQITPQKFGSTVIDIIENEGFDEVVPNERVSLEKALPALEKEFKDNSDFEVVAERVQVEIPAENKYKKPTFKTEVRSIKIVPKQQPVQKTMDSPVENVDTSIPQLTDKQKAYQLITGKTELDQSDLQLSELIPGEIVSKALNGQMGIGEVEAYQKILYTDNPFDALFENTNSLQNDQTSNEFSFNRFRITPTVEEMQSKIDELQSIAPSAAPVILVQSVDELPAGIRNHSLFSLGIYGVWYNDKVYVMADKIKSIDHLIAIWIHENGVHNGLRNILPTNERNLLMVQVYDSFRKIAEIKPEIKELFDWVNREYAGSTKQVRGEELLANLSEKIVSREDLNPEVKSIWNETIKYLRALLSKLYNFNGSLLTEGQLIEIIRVSVQSNFQKNEHSSSSQRGIGSLRKGEQRNIDGSEGNPNDGREYQDQTDGRIQAKDRSGRVLDRNGTNSANEEDSRINTPESNQELDSTDSRVNFKKGQEPLSSLLKAASVRVKQKRMPQKVRTKTDRFVSRFINGNTAIKILLEKFDLKVPDYANVFLAVNQKSSRQMGQKTHFEKKLFNPMLRSVENVMAILEKKDLKNEEAYKKVQEYMIARHAPERNRWFRSLGKKGNNFSGMTDDQAIAIYEKFESEIPRELIDELWTNTRECTGKIARYWVEYGKYTQDSLNAVVARNWKYYVPLRGFEPIAEEIQLDYEKSEKRSEFSGDEKTEGRESMADDPIAYIYQMATSAIMWGEKNRAKRSAYNLIKLNSNRKDLFEMSQMNYMTDKLGMVTEVVYETSGTFKDQKGNDKPDHKVFLMNTDEEGNTKKTELGFKSVLEGSGYTFSSSRISNPMSEKPTYLRKQHEVDVYVDGNRFKMIFKDPAISNAINGDNYSQSINFKYLPIASITRFMSRSVTSWRPSFITSNTYRDFKTGAKTMFIQRGFKDSLKFQAKYTVAARFLASNMLNDAWRNSSKTGDKLLDFMGVEPKTEKEKKWKKLYDEYNLNGGPTGQAYLMPLDEVKSKVERYIRHIKRSGSSSLARLANPLNALRLMEGLAGYGESIARFTAYAMARERGESIIMSINEAKEITTNFDTRGEYSATIGSFIMFFNASIQGAAKQYDLAKNHTFRYFAINAVSLVIQGLLSRYLWDLLNGDDDDKDYAEINKYTMYNNTVIGWKDNYVSIPLAQGYRVWNALGVAMYEHHTGRISTEQMSFDMAEVFTQALSPVEISGIFNKQGKLSAPKVAGSLFSAIKPLMDISTNEDYRKRPIFREPFLKSQQGKFADSQMHFNNTNAMIVSFTNWLYKQGGGDPELGTKTIIGKRILEKYDWNPAKIEYILKSYTGGPGQTVLDAANYMILKTVDDLDKQIKDREHKIEGFDPTSIPILQTYYHKKYTGFMYDEYREVANKAEELKFEDDRRNQANDPNRIPEISENQRDFLIDFEMTNDEIKSLLDLKKTTTDEDENKVIDLQILGLRRGFVSKYKYFGK